MAIKEVYMGRWHHVCHLKQTQQICWNHGFQGCANNSDWWWTKFRVTRHGNEIHNSKCPNDWAFQELETLHQRMWTNCLLKCPTCGDKRVVAWGPKKEKEKKRAVLKLGRAISQSCCHKSCHHALSILIIRIQKCTKVKFPQKQKVSSTWSFKRTSGQKWLILLKNWKFVQLYSSRGWRPTLWPASPNGHILSPALFVTPAHRHLSSFLSRTSLWGTFPRYGRWVSD